MFSRSFPDRIQLEADSSGAQVKTLAHFCFTRELTFHFKTSRFVTYLQDMELFSPHQEIRRLCGDSNFMTVFKNPKPRPNSKLDQCS
jgi:hypothetical protein